jgi:hypothetical protein
VRGGLSRAAALAKPLRRELAFYRDVDFIPTEQEADADAHQAHDDAAWVVRLAARVIDRPIP